MANSRPDATAVSSARHKRVRGAHVSIKPGVKRSEPQDQEKNHPSPRSGRQIWSAVAIPIYRERHRFGSNPMIQSADPRASRLVDWFSTRSCSIGAVPGFDLWCDFRNRPLARTDGGRFLSQCNSARRRDIQRRGTDARFCDSTFFWPNNYLPGIMAANTAPIQL